MFVLGMAVAFLAGIAIDRVLDAMRPELPTTPDLASAAPGGISTFDAAQYPLEMRVIAAPPDPGSGGAVAALGDRVFLLGRKGVLHRLGADGELAPVALEMPVSVAEMEPMYPRAVVRDALGFKDMVLRRDPSGRVEMTLSYTLVDLGQSCTRLAVSRALLDPAALEGGSAPAAPDWTQIYRSEPCIPAPEPAFALQSGGAMAYEANGDLLVFVGDFGIDGHGRKLDGVGPQHPGSDYGKVVRIDAATGAAIHVSLGHRNPGGLVVTATGEIWLAEHGARGGDELNLIRPGANYGWPLETYGAHYGMFTWPPDKTPGEHGRFTLPIKSWVPSIATSAVVQVTGSEFPAWDGDLLLGSLKGQALHRLRIREGRVIVDEPIPLGLRIRDLAVSASGLIYVMADEAPVLVEIGRARRAADPRAVALAPCSDCHAVSGDGGYSQAGPTLAGVLGRPVAGVEGFGYSEGLRRVGGTWTAERLRAFLLDPAGFAPGTAMPAVDLTPDQLDAVIGALGRAAPAD